MSDIYVVRRLGVETFELAKFTDNVEPSKVYTVYAPYDAKVVSCDCPGWKHTAGEDHKHVRLVRRFIRIGEPELTAFWFREDDDIDWHFFGTIDWIKTAGGLLP